MGVSEGSGDCSRGKGTFGVNVLRPIVTNGDFVAYSCEIVRELIVAGCAVCAQFKYNSMGLSSLLGYFRLVRGKI